MSPFNRIKILSKTSLLFDKAIRTLTINFPLFLLFTIYFIFPGWKTITGGNMVGSIYSIGIFLIGSFIFAFVLTLISSWNKIVRVLLLCLFSLLAYGELFNYFSQNTRIRFESILLILQTDTVEALNFLTDINSRTAILKSCIWLGCMLLLYLLLWTIWNKFDIGNKLQNFISKKCIIRTILPPPFFLTLWLTTSCLINIYIWKTPLYKHGVFNNWLNPYEHACSPMTQMTAIKQLLDWRNSWDFEKLALTNNSTRIEVVPPDSLTVVFAIGESHSRYHSSLYGYPWLTEPNMSRLHSDSSLIVYNNVITGYGFTSEVYPRLLSTHELNSKDEIYKSPLLPAVFKKAGFITEYFNNQSLIEVKKMDFSCNFLFSNSNILQQCFSFYNDKILSEECQFPKAFPVSNAKRSFTIYHFYGQHIPWHNFSDTIFRNEDYQKVHVYNDNERTAVANYDNATYQIDKILNNIINQIKDKCAILVYVSDHGDRIYDYNHEYARNQVFSLSTVKFVMEVPLYIYVSDKYKAKYPDRVAKLRAAVHKPIFNTDIAHTLIDVAGIKTDAYNPNLSLLTPGVYRKERLLPQYGMTYESLLPELEKVKPVYHLQ